MWYVIHTISGLEQKCMEQCRHYMEESAYKEIFIPQYIVQKRFQKEWHEVTKTLFPGYLFVDTKEIELVVKGLKEFRQYTKVLRDGEILSPITEEEQRVLAAMMDKQHVVRYSEGFLIGDKVCVTEGPLQNYQGCIKKIDRHRRTAQLEIPIFGRMTPVELGFEAVAKVSEEEFRRMKEENIQKQEPEERPGQVEVLTGVFEGMRGTFLYADTEQDEWTVGLELFGKETKVVFHREEITMFA